ncbi:N-acetylglucosamine-6-phosphate deacetylase [Gallaecimonas kandeliae]|uniref:N-acetylglucosamine-6-phosphate deacetylase n=1 Tax=Gallaecimonas kandeliae TaxID=3029055 RepID=UPI002649B843|nr:N-acetylglucosamine-6-phosphate deacetylase [Gallaecimonas kandeliae]WKE65888.1 N-acetylglucosamine-6-phosphate deacetylase [Gallaecimonas kandeliae]
MTDLAIKASRLVAEDRDYVDHWLWLDEGRIQAISPQAPQGAPLLEAPGCTLIPGLIDLHIHGREGADVMDATPAALATISGSLARHGVTGFLATTVTSSWAQTLAAMANVACCMDSGLPGAALLGAYSEGLFFTADHKGAHNEDYFLPLEPARLDALMAAAGGQLKVLALAPELDGALAAIPYLKEKGVRVMLGHTNADYQRTKEALAAGACGGVHVFNGMRGLHHREPGCTGAVLLEPCPVEVIADGVHLHPAILDLVYRLKGAAGIHLISDCINAGGLADGRYRLGQLDVNVSQGIARTDGGSLAGSTLTLEKAVQSMHQLAGVAFRDAVHMASLSPARFLGLDGQTGSITVGKVADLALLNNNAETMLCLGKGRVLHRHPDLPWPAP